jgi:hypothetical protein
VNEAEQETERPRRAASVRLIAGGTALGFAAAGIAGALLITATGNDGGGRAERIAEVDETTTTTTAAAAPAPGDPVVVDTTVPVGGQPAGGAPSSGGATTMAGAPAPAASATLEAQVANHEQRITDLEEAPAVAEPEPAPVVVPPPRDPPGPVRPPAPACDGRLQWSDVTGWSCLPADPPAEP